LYIYLFDFLQNRTEGKVTKQIGEVSRQGCR